MSQSTFFHDFGSLKLDRRWKPYEIQEIATKIIEYPLHPLHFAVCLHHQNPVELHFDDLYAFQSL